MATRSAFSGSNRPVSLSPSQCLRDCVRRAVAPAHARTSAGNGSPIASTSSCSSNRAAIRWPTSRRPTSLQTPYNAPSIRTQHHDLGLTSWYTVRAGERQRAARGVAAHRACPPTRASCRHGSRSPGGPWTLSTKKTNGSSGHAADPYHRIDIRATSRHLVVRDGRQVIADSRRALGALRIRFRPAVVCAPRRR
mgnify:CR=1 FL=1